MAAATVASGGGTGRDVGDGGRRRWWGIKSTGERENRMDENDAWLRVPDPFIRCDSAPLAT